MGLLEQIRLDLQRHTSSLKDFGVSITFTSNDSPPSVATIVGIATKHRLSVDRDGAPYNGKNASCSVSEQSLLEEDYPVRNDNGEVDLKGHKVQWRDSTGENITYKIESWFPDEMLGTIVCILGDYN